MTLAKIASHFGKNYNGYQHVCIIDNEEKRKKALQLTSIDEVWGVGHRLTTKMRNLGINTAWDFTQTNASWVKKTFTITGLRTWEEVLQILPLRVWNDYADNIVYVNRLPCLLAQNKYITTTLAFKYLGFTR